MSDSLSVLNTANLAQLIASSGYGLVGQVSITANVTLTTATTVYSVMTTPSILWRNNRAYLVTVSGLAASANATNYIAMTLLKGTGTGGASWKGQIRFPLLPTSSLTTNTFISFSTVLVNTSGADITSTMTLTASIANAPTTGTTAGQFSASTSNVAYMTVSDVGSAVNWPGQPIS